MAENSYFNRDRTAIINTYSRIPVDISYGENVYLISKEGRRYLDFFSGLAVNSLGYNHPRIIEVRWQTWHRCAGLLDIHTLVIAAVAVHVMV